MLQYSRKQGDKLDDNAADIKNIHCTLVSLQNKALCIWVQFCFKLNFQSIFLGSNKVQSFQIRKLGFSKFFLLQTKQFCFLQTSYDLPINTIFSLIQKTLGKFGYREIIQIHSLLTPQFGLFTCQQCSTLWVCCRSSLCGCVITHCPIKGHTASFKF